MNKKLLMTAVVAGLISGKLAMADHHEGKSDDKAKKEHSGCQKGCSKNKKKKAAIKEAAPAPAPEAAPAPAAPTDGNH